jgi:hypothetical protein
VGTVRDSLVLFERNSISSYFDKLPEANTVGVCDTIPLLQVLHGICLNFTASFLRVMLLLGCTLLLFLYVFPPVTRTIPTYKGSRESSWSVVSGGEVVEIAGYTNA